MNSSKLIAVGIIIGVLSLLIFSGPASAYLLGLSAVNPEVIKGEEITFYATINNQIETESMIDSITLNLNNLDKNISCRFSLEGAILEDCNGITIAKISGNTGYGYCGNDGYGYSTVCALNYSITLDSNKFDVGLYDTKLIVTTKSKNEEIQGPEIIINNKPAKLDKSCSVRAKKGELIVENKEFKNARINFYIPFDSKATGGEGYLTGQKARDRFMYRFKVEKILLNTFQITKVQISGQYRIGTKNNVFERAILTFDRVNNKTSVIGDKISANDLSIYFRKGC